MRVVVLHDALRPNARPDEQDTLVQVEHVTRALAALGHDVRALPLELDLSAARAELIGLAPDGVFNLVESVGGEGRLIHLAPALLESLRIPFTGAGSEAMFVSTSKSLSKRLFRAGGIDTPASFTRNELESMAEDASSRPFESGEYIIKSVWEHASLGLDGDSVVEARKPAELLSSLDARESGLGGEAFAEAFIDGREFNVAMLETGLGVEILPIAEMAFDDWPTGAPRIVGYDAKWSEHTMEYANTVRRFGTAEPALARDLERVARRSWEALEMRGYARVDVRVDRRDRVWALEVNANPCLSPDAGYVAACAHAGRTLGGAVETILDVSMRTRRVGVR